MKIPVVSLAALSADKPTNLEWHQTANELGQALEHVGFVYLSNHGISETKIRRVFEESAKFFALPAIQKMKYERDFETTFHGYTQISKEVGSGESCDTNGKENKVSLQLREMFDAALADTDVFSNCRYPDDQIPQFKLVMKELMRECKIVTVKLLKLLALSLNLEDEDYFVKCHQNMDDSSIPNFTQLRTLYYPPINDDVIGGGDNMADVVRCAAHTDYGSVTFLFQDSVGGLQIKCIDGSWMDARPIPGCILINVGDLMHIWSGGRFPSTIHRVILPRRESGQDKLGRQSLALFVKPDNSTLVSPLIQHERKVKCLVAENPYLPQSTLAGEHFQTRTVNHQHKLCCRRTKPDDIFS